MELYVARQRFSFTEVIKLLVRLILLGLATKRLDTGCGVLKFLT